MSLSREASPVPHEVGHVVHTANEHRSVCMVEFLVEIFWCLYRFREILPCARYRNILVRNYIIHFR